jgi:hypothetical protein
MTRFSELAMEECVEELRAACRRPIEETALQTLIEWVRPQFTEILDRPEGRTYWSDCGHHMRNNGRYIGGLADFLSHQSDVDVVGASELMQAFTMVRDACRVGAEQST